VVLDGTTALISWAAPRESVTAGMSWAYVACMPILHAFLYALAVAGTCWLRKPFVGGLMAVMGYLLVTVAMGAFRSTSTLEPINVYNRLCTAERRGGMEFGMHGYFPVYGSLVLMVLLLALLACQLAKPLQPVSALFSGRKN
jgi:hypothetical protein